MSHLVQHPVSHSAGQGTEAGAFPGVASWPWDSEAGRNPAESAPSGYPPWPLQGPRSVLSMRAANSALPCPVVPKDMEHLPEGSRSCQNHSQPGH